MERREFMKLCSVAGLGVVSASLTDSQPVQAQAGPDQYLMTINFSGGLDTTILMDPKGETINDDGYAVNDPLTSFGVDNIRSIGSSLTYPDIPGFASNRTFFEDEGLGSYCTILRGVDQQTNGHDSGQRNQWSGRLAANSPCFAALFAAAHGSTLPMAFVTNGGYDSTFGVPVAKTRLGNADQLFPLIYPNRTNPDDDQSGLYHTQETFKRILATRQARLDNMIQTQNLPLIKRAMSLLYTSRLGMEELKKIDEYIQLIEQNDPNGLGQGLARQGKLLLAAFKAGLAVAGTVSGGGYDTHGQNDANAIPRAASQMDAVVEIFRCAVDVLDMAEEVLYVFGSDFARTPMYNGNAGRDHWSTTSCMIMDPSGAVPGGRAIGATDGTLRPINLNPSTMQPDVTGVRVTPGHWHKWLRKHTGIEGSETTKLFPVEASEAIDFTQGT